ncbi:crotonase/enoyl-CoA hydratase family protein [Verticiella sediminum]
MNQPDKRNALTGNTAVAEFGAACRRIEEDHSIKVVILTGTGTVFSSGGNIHEMQRQLDPAILPADLRHEYREGIQRLPLALYNLEVPVIAAVNGPAIGAGCDLACMCDIRIAADTARFAESFVKLGIIPGDGGAWLLPRTIGMSRAAELTFTGDTIDAQQALDWGLVSRVVPGSELLAAARELAQRIAANSGPALRMSKRLLREGQHTRLDTLLELSAGMQALAHRTAEHQAAVQAFVQRKPAKG